MKRELHVVHCVSASDVLYVHARQLLGHSDNQHTNIQLHTYRLSTKIRLMKALVWRVATYGCESWTVRKNEETRLDAYEMKGLRRMLRVSWTERKQMSGFLTKLE